MTLQEVMDVHGNVSLERLAEIGEEERGREERLARLRENPTRPLLIPRTAVVEPDDPCVPLAAAQMANAAAVNGWRTAIVHAADVPIAYSWEHRAGGWLLGESVSVRGRRTALGPTGPEGEPEAVTFGFAAMWTRDQIPPRLTPKQREKAGEPEDSVRISPVGLRWRPVGGHAWEVCSDPECAHAAQGEHPAGVPVHLNITELGKAIRA